MASLPYVKDPRVDASLDPLPDWQQEVKRDGSLPTS
jgi:hypothetical protein